MPEREPLQRKKRVAERYTKERNTYKLDKVPEPKRRMQIEVGDSKEDGFIPQVKLMGWDNEVNFSMRLADNQFDGIVREQDDRIEYEKDGRTARFYEIDDSDFEDGAFEFDLVLTERPLTNVIEFTVRAKNLKAYFQPALPQEILSKYRIAQPERFVRSWYIRHAHKRNNEVAGNEYRTGKFGQIPRPYFTDADGNKVWCDFDLPIDADNNIIDGGIAKLHLADEYKTAPLPIVIDPTFGLTSVGEFEFGFYNSSIETNNLAFSKFNLGEGGDVTKLTAYIRRDTAADLLSLAAIYSDNSGVPNAREGYTPTKSVTTSFAWEDYIFGSAVSLTSADYWIGPIYTGGSTNTGQSILIAFDIESAGDGYDGNIVPANPPTDPFSAFNPDSISWRFSVYATYTAAGTEVNSARAAKTHGVDTANSARSAKATGVDSATSSRAAKTHGQASATSNRSAKVRGSNDHTSTRPAKTSGTASANSARAATVEGDSGITLTAVQDNDRAQLTWNSVLLPLENNWSFVVVPDTQRLAPNNPTAYNDLIQWIVDEVEGENVNNIKMVVILGDIVNNGASSSEWAVAETAIARLHGVVPFIMMAGNHDYDDDGQGTYSRKEEFWKAAFPHSDFTGYDWYLGSYNNVTTNMAAQIQVGQYRYRFIGTEFWPRDAALTWAKNLADASEYDRLIWGTHALIAVDSNYETDDPADTSGGQGGVPLHYGVCNDSADGDCKTGLEMYNEFISQQNRMLFAFCGHEVKDHPTSANGIGGQSAFARRTETVGGNPVSVQLLNYQNMSGNTYADSAYLRIVKIDHALNSYDIETYNPVRDTNLTDAQNQFSGSFD